VTLRQRRREDDATDAYARADAGLRDRADLRQRRLGDDLVEAPYDAEDERQRSGQRIEGLAFIAREFAFGREKSREAAGGGVGTPWELRQRAKCVINA